MRFAQDDRWKQQPSNVHFYSQFYSHFYSIFYFQLTIKGERFALLFLFLPEPFGDVFELAGGGFAVHALIGGALAERSEMTYVRSYLDVVEVGLHDEGGNAEASAVPRHFEGGMMLVDVLRQTVDGTRVGVATHEGYAGDVFTVFLNEGVDGGGVERQSDVLPQVVAMTARTVARTVGQVDGKRHFVRHLLKYYSGIDIFEHSSVRS